MAQFSSPKYPHLTLQDDKGVWAQFEGGQFETTDAAAIRRLRSLPDDYEVAEVKSSAKTSGGDGGQQQGGGDGKPPTEPGK